jgi:hypothetical protein
VDPGSVVDLQASGTDATGRPAASPRWSWSQVGSGTDGPWATPNPDGSAAAWKGYLWNLGGDRAQWVADWGNAKSGQVVVTAMAGNGATGSIAVRIRNVAPQKDATSVSPVVAGNATGNTVTVAANTVVNFMLRYKDGNGMTEEPGGGGSRWRYELNGLNSFEDVTGNGIVWTIDHPSRSFGYTSWTQSLKFGPGQSGSVTFTVRDGPTHTLTQTWQVTVQ